MSRAALALLLSACAEPTQLVVVCDTDLEPGVDIATIDVSVASSGTFGDAYVFPLDSTQLPFSLGVTPARRDDETVFVTARGFSPNGAIVVRFQAETRFVPHQVRVLEIPLARSCTAEACDGSDLTCLRGECVSPVIDPASLPPYDGAALAPLFDEHTVAPDAGALDAGPPCVEGASCATGNPCEVGVLSCGIEPLCEATGTLPSGADCGGGRSCDLEGRCGL